MKKILRENMKRRLAKVLGNESGVTLIELLAVVVILAIIAAVAIPAVMGNFSSAKTNTDKQNSTIIADAINRLILDETNSGETVTTITGTDYKLIDLELTTTTVNASNDNGQKLTDLLTQKEHLNAGAPYLTTIPTPETGSNSGSTFTLTDSPSIGSGYGSVSIGGKTYYIVP